MIASTRSPSTVPDFLRSLWQVSRALAVAIGGALGLPAEAHADGLFRGCVQVQTVTSSAILNLGSTLGSLRGQIRNLWWSVSDSSSLWEAHVGSTGRGRCGIGLEDIAIFAVLGTVLITMIRARRATIRQRLDLARAMVERGQEPPTDLLSPPGNDLHRGFVLIFAGLGLLAASYVSRGTELSPGGLIPLFIGLGYLLSHRFARSLQGPRS